MIYALVLFACSRSSPDAPSTPISESGTLFTGVPSKAASSEITSTPNTQVTSLHSPTASLVTIVPAIKHTTIGVTPTPDELSFKMCSPLSRDTIPELWEIVSDPYSPPPPGREERHQGVDFSYYRRKAWESILGEAVQAILPGRVAAVIRDRLPYGNMIILETPLTALPPMMVVSLPIDAGEALYHLYAHMERAPEFTLGESVDCGQELGKVGTTGYNIVNPHLHLETRLGPAGQVFEGMVFYDTSATPAEMENYRRWRTSGEFQHFDPMVLFASYLNYLGVDVP